MNTQQLDAILSGDRHAGPLYLGTYSWDLVPSMSRESACVVNTDCSERPGAHWVLYVHRAGVTTFFDSFGQHPRAYPGLPATVDEFNTRQVQNMDSGVCGQWCVYVLLSMARGRRLAEVVSAFDSDRHVNDHFVAAFVNQNYGLDLDVHAINNKPVA